MAKDAEFHDYVVHDLLGDSDEITSRAMFGGYGLYSNGIIFGIIADGNLYFKVDESNRKEYESFGSEPFHYSRKDKDAITMSYWLIPEEIMENRARFQELVFQSTAINAKKKSAKKRR